MPTGTARHRPRTLADYFDALSRPVFQGGISWKVVEAKWPDIRAAFHKFDPEWVSALTPKQIDKLAADPRVIRNRRKIEGTVENARTLLELDAVHRGFRRYLRSFKDFDALSRDLRSHFRFLGDFGAYQFLWMVGEPVPAHEEWMRQRGDASRRTKAGQAKRSRPDTRRGATTRRVTR